MSTVKKYTGITESETRSFSDRVKEGLAFISPDLQSSLLKEATHPLNNPGVITKEPVFEHRRGNRKFFPASKKERKNNYFIWVARKEYVKCECPAYRLRNICKHSLCVAEMNSMLDKQLQHAAKGKRKDIKICIA